MGTCENFTQSGVNRLYFILNGLADEITAMVSDIKPHLIHRPGCVPGKRDPLCVCRRMGERRKRASAVWRDLGYESEEAHKAWLKRISVRGPFFRSWRGGNHNL
jgi:hypothetical protein